VRAWPDFAPRVCSKRIGWPITTFRRPRVRGISHLSMTGNTLMNSHPPTRVLATPASPCRSTTSAVGYGGPRSTERISAPSRSTFRRRDCSYRVLPLLRSATLDAAGLVVCRAASEPRILMHCDEYGPPPPGPACGWCRRGAAVRRGSFAWPDQQAKEASRLGDVDASYSRTATLEYHRLPDRARTL
jgi:hypothetical protein